MANQFALPVATAGNLERYIQSVKQFPILSAKEEAELGRQLHQNNDLNAARQLILSHLRVVVSIARGYHGYGLPQADLIQEGNIGLMKAVRRFDPDRGVRLVSFAIHWIKAEINEYIIRNWKMVKIATTKAQRRLFFNLRSMKQNLGFMGKEEIHEIARELKVKPEEVIEMDMRISGHDCALENPDDEGPGPLAYLADPGAEPSVLLENLEQEKRLNTELNDALSHLDARSRRVIETRWLNPDHALTLHDLASEFNVSAERIRQIEQKALKQLKNAMIDD
ncbi:MAG: RNA polymerase sigma factor RpoH [Proteobacteria bacterium]|nr:RNA polymerase sigma factor RpoH [Pseudomonadota bacterium]MDE3208949.1 RNA polymerase sigma factor RpoH [Pseudomonadota bacterium]